MSVKNELAIHNFFDEAIIRDFSRDYLFRVMEINFSGGFRLTPDTGLLYAKSGKIPGRSIVDHEVKYAGQTFHVPGSVTYPGSENYELEFYCPESSGIREALITESRRTFGSYGGVGGSGNNPDFAGGSIANRDSYVILSQLNKQLEPVTTYRLVGCSIRNVGEMQYNFAEGTGAVMVFNVGVAYHFFESISMGTSGSVQTTPDRI